MSNFDVKNIQNPSFLKNLSYKDLDLLSADIREEILDVVSKNGGHLSSNLGSVESIIALCKVFDFPKDKIIFDVGHQCYTYKILTGRDLSSLRQKDGLSGFQKMSESEYDCYECGHSSTSIGAAMGFATARDIKGEDYSVIAYIGDASFDNGLAFEAITNLNKEHSKVIIVLNDNGMSIGLHESGLSGFFRNISKSNIYAKNKSRYKKVMGLTKFGRALMKPFSAIKHWIKRHLISPNIFDVLDIDYLGTTDGHNIKKMVKIFERAKKAPNSIVIRIKTKKGKGYPYTENDAEGIYHGVTPFDKETGKIIHDDNKTSWQDEISINLHKVMADNPNTVLICPATSLGSSLNNIKQNFPDRFFDVGINEEHSIIYGSGMSANNIHPIISMYSTFMQRSYDEISHDLARMKLNSTILVDRAGLVGDDGETHQGIYDVSYLYSIPNCVITMPSHPSQIHSLMNESLKNHGPFFIRYPKECIKKETYDSTYVPFGKWIKEIDNPDSKVAIVSYGPNIENILDKLIEKSLNLDLFNAIYLRPISNEMINSLMKYEKIVIYDEYSTKQGLVNELISLLVNNGYKGEIKYKCIPDIFVSQGTIKQQKEDLNLTIEKLFELL